MSNQFTLQIPSSKFYEIVDHGIKHRPPEDCVNVRDVFLRVTGKTYYWNDDIDSIREVVFASEDELIMFKLQWL